MSEMDFAKEVHKRLCAMNENEAAISPVDTLFRISRQVALRHPVRFVEFLWWRYRKTKQMRAALRDDFHELTKARFPEKFKDEDDGNG